MSHEPLSQELSDALHEESAGIVDFAVKLFLLAQVRAISTGNERITPAILRSVAKDSLRLAQPALNAIRTGDMRAVATMTDLHPIDFQSAVQQIRKVGLLETLSKGSQIVSDIHAAAAATPALPEAAVSASESNRQNPQPSAGGAKAGVKRRRGNHTATPSKCLLVQTVQAGLAKDASAHDALAEVGLIKSPFTSQQTSV